MILAEDLSGDIFIPAAIGDGFVRRTCFVQFDGEQLALDRVVKATRQQSKEPDEISRW